MDDTYQHSIYIRDAGWDMDSIPLSVDHIPTSYVGGVGSKTHRRVLIVISVLRPTNR